MTDKQQNYIDTKFPITWLLSSGVAIVLSCSALIWQLQISALAITEIKTTLSDIKTGQEKRDNKIVTLSDYDIDSRNQIVNIQAQIARLNIEFAELRKEQYGINNRNRYMPLK